MSRGRSFLSKGSKISHGGRSPSSFWLSKVWLPCGERSSPVLWRSKRQAVFRWMLASCTLLDFSGRRLVIRSNYCTLHAFLSSQATV
ncbi:hypothetical protein CapIbe_021149 [Capra ibex]